MSFSRLRINHYYTKSEEEFMRKVARRRVGGAVMEPFDPEDFRQAEERTGEPDETILIYLDSLEESARGPIRVRVRAEPAFHYRCGSQSSLPMPACPHAGMPSAS